MSAREPTTTADYDRGESLSAERFERDRPGWHVHVFERSGRYAFACWCGDTVTEADAS